MDTYLLKKEDLLRFYDRISEEYDLFVPVKLKGTSRPKCEYSFNLPTDDYMFERYSKVNKDDIAFNEYRSVEPIRAFFTHAREDVARYFKGGEGAGDAKPAAICGVKNCDIFS